MYLASLSYDKATANQALKTWKVISIQGVRNHAYPTFPKIMLQLTARSEIILYQSNSLELIHSYEPWHTYSHIHTYITHIHKTWFIQTIYHYKLSCIQTCTHNPYNYKGTISTISEKVASIDVGWCNWTAQLWEQDTTPTQVHSQYPYSHASCSGICGWACKRLRYAGSRSQAERETDNFLDKLTFPNAYFQLRRVELLDVRFEVAIQQLHYNRLEHHDGWRSVKQLADCQNDQMEY